MAKSEASVWITALLGGIVGACLPRLAQSTFAAERPPREIPGPMWIQTPSSAAGIFPMGDAGGGLGFNNSAGHGRLSAQVYPDGTQSCFGLMNKDVEINPHVFFRTDGSNSGPMLFFKNQRDQHRIDIGLDINSEDEDPYFVYFDKYGDQHAVFGKFPYVANAGGIQHQL